MGSGQSMPPLGHRAHVLLSLKPTFCPSFLSNETLTPTLITKSITLDAFMSIYFYYSIEAKQNNYAACVLKLCLKPGKLCTLGHHVPYRGQGCVANTSCPLTGPKECVTPFKDTCLFVAKGKRLFAYILRTIRRIFEIQTAYAQV